MKKVIIFLCLLSAFACTSKKALVNTEARTKTEDIIKKSESKDSVATNTTNEKSKTNTENNSIVFEGVKFDSTGLIRYADKVIYNRSKVQEDKEKQSVSSVKVVEKDTVTIQQKVLKKEEKRTIDKSKSEFLSWKLWLFVIGLIITIILLIKFARKPRNL